MWSLLEVVISRTEILYPLIWTWNDINSTHFPISLPVGAHRTVHKRFEKTALLQSVAFAGRLNIILFVPSISNPASQTYGPDCSILRLIGLRMSCPGSIWSTKQESS